MEDKSPVRIEPEKRRGPKTKWTKKNLVPIYSEKGDILYYLDKNFPIEERMAYLAALAKSPKGVKDSDKLSAIKMFTDLENQTTDEMQTFTLRVVLED